MPEEWEAAKVVMIPNPNPARTIANLARAWRSINLINCVGKLAEKVVASDL